MESDDNCYIVFENAFKSKFQGSKMNAIVNSRDYFPCNRNWVLHFAVIVIAVFRSYRNRLHCCLNLASLVHSRHFQRLPESPAISRASKNYISIIRSEVKIRIVRKFQTSAPIINSLKYKIFLWFLCSFITTYQDFTGTEISLIYGHIAGQN